LVEYEGFKIPIQLWGLAIQERYRPFIRLYYKEATATIFSYPCIKQGDSLDLLSEHYKHMNILGINVPKLPLLADNEKEPNEHNRLEAFIKEAHIEKCMILSNPPYESILDQVLKWVVEKAIEERASGSDV
jgi:hypothetical protein